MKLIINGGRDFENYELAKQEFDKVFEHYNILEIVSGGARGSDKIGERLAKEYDIPLKRFIPDWDGLGKKAGHVRNREMGDYADALLSFWDGESKGTKGMIEYAERKNLFIKVVRY